MIGRSLEAELDERGCFERPEATETQLGRLRDKPHPLSVAVHPRQREHVAGAKEARTIGKEEEVRVHCPFRMSLVCVDEIVLALLGRRDGQDGEIRKAVVFGVQPSLPGVGV